MMRKLLLSLSAVAGATAALASHANAAPVALAVTVAPPAHIQTVQYYDGWRHQEWRRREAYERWRRHEERRRWHEHHHRGW